MKTNIGIETTDEEREKVARYLDLKHKLATRGDIKTFVNKCIRTMIDDEEPEAPDPLARPKATPCEAEPETKVEAFIPSRGDEEYLAQPKDSGLAAACSRILDDLALIENHTWDTIERNRK